MWQMLLWQHGRQGCRAGSTVLHSQHCCFPGILTSSAPAGSAPEGLGDGCCSSQELQPLELPRARYMQPTDLPVPTRTGCLCLSPASCQSHWNLFQPRNWQPYRHRSQSPPWDPRAFHPYKHSLTIPEPSLPTDTDPQSAPWDPKAFHQQHLTTISMVPRASHNTLFISLAGRWLLPSRTVPTFPSCARGSIQGMENIPGAPHTDPTLRSCSSSPSAMTTAGEASPGTIPTSARLRL